jgi:hypothetical protein
MIKHNSVRLKVIHDSLQQVFPIAKETWEEDSMDMGSDNSKITFNEFLTLLERIFPSKD